ncbi:SET domain-containing protein [Metschnikowia bicuspidata var. bicuspidata NRRL YB-4993]|uniref:SET domain-containing protein n=1 Tax=Metschnikowia bicuspidata var. bicuspidata NRRL YB-4993 TaxID=869754 RepID=A0A1A0HG70_9ASCO|nr:SET domain-containing protein [Metschnikowia bicuspidata var. bicuspidata NRRL YB-4993]OBA23001.1 SET domain-containing protein [Metschnikowia bicuspidata var. bicuspidata NRRL YB-4993]
MTAQKINTLLDWAKENGAQISDDVQFVPIAKNNVGATSTSQASSIKVPTKIIMKLSDAISGLGFDTSDIMAKQRNVNCPLKLFLAKERAAVSDSFYRPYIETLPTMAQINSPYVWLPEDNKNLQGTNLGSSLRENIVLLVEEWWLAISLLPESVPKPEAHFLNMKFYYEHKFYEDSQMYGYVHGDTAENWTSFPAYLWASMILKSRSFPSALLKDASLEISEIDLCQDDVAMLIPVVDLLNHSPQADVTWTASGNFFQFQSHRNGGLELFNNYGRKGNEELLLAYGFCLDNNAADTVALKIKVPEQMLPELESHGVSLPQISDYTTSVVSNQSQSDPAPYDQYRDGLLFFIAKDRVPEDLVRVFQWLVKGPWEGSKLTLRMQLSGLNHLRQAVESKAALINVNNVKSQHNETTIRTYLRSQKAILQAAVSDIKHRESALLADHKSNVTTLKSIYKKDVKFAQSLLVTMGVTSYEDIVDQELMDQVWLLYLIRCFNKEAYSDEDPEEQYLPGWIHDAFVRMDAEVEMVAAEVVQFQGLYENLILPMNKAVPEIYNKGKWTVRELIVSTKLLDTISFVRGKKQECLLVNDF